jgi:energy-coupling factor transport system substrate-specific component
MKKSYICLALIFLIGAAAFVPPFQELVGWGLISTVIIALAILAFFFEFEAAAVSSKEIALVAMMGTLSAVLRIPFAVIPNVQPCTYLIICTGYVFGPVAGFMVGSITALISNFLLGQGPWTPYQMFAWGLAGVSAGYLRRFRLNIIWLIIIGAIWGYVYGWIMNSWFWVSFIYPLTLKTFFVYQLHSIWFDTLHAVGNAVFLGLFGTKTIAILDRFRQRFSWSFLGAHTGTGPA